MFINLKPYLFASLAALIVAWLQSMCRTFVWVMLLLPNVPISYCPTLLFVYGTSAMARSVYLVDTQIKIFMALSLAFAKVGLKVVKYRSAKYNV